VLVEVLVEVVPEVLVEVVPEDVQPANTSVRAATAVASHDFRKRMGFLRSRSDDRAV